MGEQSAARLEGDRYQHLFSWWLILDLLNPGVNATEKMSRPLF